MKLTHIHPNLTLPNLISGIRFITAPLMLWLAWNNYGKSFMIVLAIAFLSDVVDGLVARLTIQTTELGAMLDTWGDLVTYMSIGFGSWWLWPEIVHREDSYLYTIVACFLIPALYATLKFDTYISYHTYSIKVAAVTLCLSFYPLFLSDTTWPFRISVFIYIIAAIEQVLITFTLDKLQSNVRSIWHVHQQRQNY